MVDDDMRASSSCDQDVGIDRGRGGGGVGGTKCSQSLLCGRKSPQYNDCLYLATTPQPHQHPDYTCVCLLIAFCPNITTTTPTNDNNNHLPLSVKAHNTATAYTSPPSRNYASIVVTHVYAAPPPPPPPTTTTTTATEH